jgi:selenocysteine-specific elongation factor
MIRAILGTAGHIDHGKSALVRALTGIETDRLPEEKRRGISIELGFAHLDIAEVGRIGVVDVPGHERFVRQMLAGAHGFDLVLVVVAADDGVMPQTEEHFDIVHLLGVERAIFVLSKSDVATAERIASVREEIEILAAGTRFETAPVVVVSARSGEGIEALRAEIAAALRALAPRPTHGAFRLPVDRVFVSHGRGVVVTGTALAGVAHSGDAVRILPSGRTARVREIQVHGEAVAEASAGQRVAINLAGVEHEDIERGDTIAAAEGLSATLRLDARIEVRPAAGKSLASHRRVRVHHAARETFGRLVWLDGVREVAAREAGFAQLALEEPLVALPGDRFILRDETARRTIGGGVVLLAKAAKHRRTHGDIAPSLQLLEEGDNETRLATYLELAGGAPVTEALAATGLDAGALAKLLASATQVVALPDAKAPQLLFSSSQLASALARLREAVEEFQREHPSAPGVDLEHLRGRLRPVTDPTRFRLLVEHAAQRGELRRRGNVVHTKDHAASLSGGDEALALRIRDRISTAAAMPPTTKELAAEIGADAARVTKICAVLVLRGELEKVTPELFFSREVLADVGARLADKLRSDGEITPAGFRDLIAASRKYGIPLLDWFDRSGLTIRVGDVRRLRRVSS